MNKITFTVDGIEGEFECDYDELTSYKTLKQLACAEKNTVGMFEAAERIYMGKDEEYVERVGGIDGLKRLNDAAFEAAKAKNSSPLSLVASDAETN